MRLDVSPTEVPDDAVGLYRMLDSKALFLRYAPALIGCERSER